MRGGKCNREACSYKHDPSYAAATPAKDGNAKAKAEAKEKARSKAKAKSNPAAPVVAIIDSDDGQTSSGSEWEEADTDASTGDHAAVSEVKRSGKKVSSSKETNFTSSLGDPFVTEGIKYGKSMRTDCAIVNVQNKSMTVIRHGPGLN